MKVANIIMAYKNPAQLERMIKSMDHPNFYIFVHLDKKIEIEPFEYLSKLDRVVFIKNRTLCNWGGFSFVNAIFNCLEEVLDLEEGYDFYNLLSGQDYPIKPMEDISRFYENNQGKCFISYDEDHEKDWWKHAVTRFENYHFTDLTFKGRYFIQGLITKYLPKRKFPIDLQLFGSSISTWWTVSPGCASYMVDFMKENKKLKKFMAYTWGADEFLVASIVMNSPFRDQVINNNLRYITWVDGIANPRILIEGDLDGIKESDKLFARKFDIVIDEKVLDEIDSLITPGNIS